MSKSNNKQHEAGSENCDSGVAESRNRFCGRGRRAQVTEAEHLVLRFELNISQNQKEDP